MYYEGLHDGCKNVCNYKAVKPTTQKNNNARNSHILHNGEAAHATAFEIFLQDTEFRRLISCRQNIG